MYIYGCILDEEEYDEADDYDGYGWDDDDDDLINDDYDDYDDDLRNYEDDDEKKTFLFFLSFPAGSGQSCPNLDLKHGFRGDGDDGDDDDVSHGKVNTD